MADLPVILIYFALEAYKYIIIIRILVSWLRFANIYIDPYNPVMQFLASITDPVLVPLRQYFTISMIDLSPVVVLISIEVVQRMLVDLT
jgi:YggT family protein